MQRRAGQEAGTLQLSSWAGGSWGTGAGAWGGHLVSSNLPLSLVTPWSSGVTIYQRDFFFFFLGRGGDPDTQGGGWWTQVWAGAWIDQSEKLMVNALDFLGTLRQRDADSGQDRFGL